MIATNTDEAIGRRQCEEITVKVSQDLAVLYTQRSGQVTVSADDLLVLSNGGKGIVIHAADLRPAIAKTAKKASQSYQTSLSLRQRRQRKQMSTVTAVYHMGRYRSTISGKWVWASMGQDAKTAITSGFKEALSRDPQQHRDWVMRVDGEPHQLNSIKAIAKKRSVSLTILLDFIHVLEYLWKAALCFFPLGSEAVENRLQERTLEILRGKARDVASDVTCSDTLRWLFTKVRKNADNYADYLLNYRQHLRYDQYLDRGYLIALRGVEGAFRHLVSDRIDIIGARWRLDRAEAVLRIYVSRKPSVTKVTNDNSIGNRYSNAIIPASFKSLKNDHWVNFFTSKEPHPKQSAPQHHLSKLQ